MWSWFSLGPAWRAVVERKSTELADSIKSGAEELAQHAQSPLRDDFLRATACQIVRNIQDGLDGWNAEAVMLAYIGRAIEAHAATNCLTEVMFAQALECARELDEDFARTGQIRGPLHGVPVSFKDQFEIAGVDAAIGFTEWAFKPCKDDAIMVQQIRAAGAIPFAKTNVPQTMLSFECANPLNGITTSPWNPGYTPGGSSGGEAALLACSGSALGFGSDVGGSLRIPAHYSGVFSLKSGTARFSKEGARSVHPGFEAIRTQIGPMARSVEDLKLVCQTLFGLPGGPGESLPPVKWRDVKLPEKLRIGYYKQDRFVESSPACARAVQEAVDALRREGHDCIEFEPPGVLESMEIFVALTSADGYHELLSHLGPDPREKAMFLTTLGPRLPWFVRTFARWVVTTFIGDTVFANLLMASRIKGVREFTAWTAKRDAMIHTFAAQVWKAHKFDAIIAPVQAMPALPHGATATLAPLAGSTAYYNVLHLPAGVVPVTRVKETDTWTRSADAAERTLGSTIFGGNCREIYDAKAMAGLPVGVQVVGNEWEEEKVLEVMAVLDDALGKRGFGPGTWPTDKEP